MGEVENRRLRKGLCLKTVYMMSRCQLVAFDLYFPQLDCKIAEGRHLLFSATFISPYHTHCCSRWRKVTHKGTNDNIAQGDARLINQVRQGNVIVKMLFVNGEGNLVKAGEDQERPCTFHQGKWTMTLCQRCHCDAVSRSGWR